MGATSILKVGIGTIFEARPSLQLGPQLVSRHFYNTSDDRSQKCSEFQLTSCKPLQYTQTLLLNRSESFRAVRLELGRAVAFVSAGA